MLRAVVCAGAMGAGAPKQTPPTPPPPPVRQTGEDIAFTKEEERKKQGARRGYAATLNPSRSLFTPGAGAAGAAEPKRTTTG